MVKKYYVVQLFFAFLIVQNTSAQNIVTTSELNGADGTVFNDDNRGPDFPGGERTSLEIRY